VVERAEGSPRDDDDGNAEVAGPVAHVVAIRKRYAPTSHAFHGKMGEARAQGLDFVIERLEIDGAIFDAGGKKGRGGFAEMERVDLVEGEAGIQRVSEVDSVLAVAGGDGFKRCGVMSQFEPLAHKPAGEVSLADAGVGAGDEEVHGEGEPRAKSVELRSGGIYNFSFFPFYVLRSSL